MPIQAIIFDKDGTLHDTEKVFMQAWKLAAAELNVPDIETTVHDCTGTTIEWIGQYWAKKYPHIPFEDYLPRRQYHFGQLVKEGVPVKEGAHELLAYLKEHGYRIGMATSTGYGSAMDHLSRTNMLDYFTPEAIITGNMVKNGKPAPDIYLMAAERLGVSPDVCIGVEDSLNGVRAIHAAGMRGVMIPDMMQPTPEVEKLYWKKCDTLLDIIPLLTESN